MKSLTFKEQFFIGNRLVGTGCPCLIIAEAGVAHFGNFERAKELVDLAAAAKADVFKTQLFDVEELFSDAAQDWKERLRPRNLTYEEILELKDYSEECGLIFMATAHDQSRISWLEKLNVSAVKVGSGERNNPQFLKNISQLGKPIILSTGMYAKTDVEEAISACAVAGCNELALLHCVTSYPTPDEYINLASVDSLSELFTGPVGYSDHSVDGLSILGAVAKGAKIVERHITTLKNVPNSQDWKVSSDWADFHILVENIRRIEKMIGDKELSIQPIEEAGMAWALKSLIYKNNLNSGHILNDDDFVAKRPGGGIKPSKQKTLLGKKLKHPISAGKLVEFEDLE